jgi:hypothetical protein
MISTCASENLMQTMMAFATNTTNVRMDCLMNVGFGMGLEPFTNVDVTQFLTEPATAAVISSMPQVCAEVIAKQIQTTTEFAMTQMTASELLMPWEFAMGNVTPIATTMACAMTKNSRGARIQAPSTSTPSHSLTMAPANSHAQAIWMAMDSSSSMIC